MQICEKIADGQSLRQIAKEGGMPKPSTVCLWLTKHKDFAEQYAHAREAQAEMLAQDIIAVADDSEIDPNARRIMVDARKWVASKLLPKKYGDKIETEHSGTIEVVRREMKDA